MISPSDTCRPAVKPSRVSKLAVGDHVMDPPCDHLMKPPCDHLMKPP